METRTPLTRYWRGRRKGCRCSTGKLNQIRLPCQSNPPACAMLVILLLARDWHVQQGRVVRYADPVRQMRACALGADDWHSRRPW
jgi:hypothetical protein